jgi:ABC-type ATPase involved in cell division
MTEDFRIDAENIAVRDWLKPTSLDFAKGDLAVVTGGSDDAKIALALVLSGHMRSFRGEITIAGAGVADLRPRKVKRELRRISAVVDAPKVSTPYEHTKLKHYVAQELSLAGRPSGRGCVREFLDEQGLTDYADAELDETPKSLYLDIAMLLATMREGVNVLHLVLPDRYDDEPSAWKKIARKYHESGYTVLVYCQRRSADRFKARKFEVGAV